MEMTKSIGFWRKLRALWRANGANVAMMFGLSLLPLAIATGAGLDFAHAMMVRQSMLDALDSAALAVGAQPGLSQADAQKLAQQVFDANYKSDQAGSSNPHVDVPTMTSGKLTLAVSDFPVKTSLLALVGKSTLPVSASSTVVWGQTKLWVSLVLDNTGSMSETDSTGTSKMSALITASHQLLDILKNAAVNPGDVRAAIVPFAKDVKVGTSYVNASWIDWSNWASPPPYSAPSSSVGPGSSCPFSDGCVSQPGSTQRTNNVPSSGTYAGYICPDAVRSSSAGQTGHYYDGCYTSVASGTTSQVVGTGRHASCNGYSSCSCTGSGNSTVCTAQVPTYSHAWVVNDHSLWSGCLMDRNQDDDTTNATPGNGFPAENDQSCPTSSITPLSYDWTALNNAVDAMSPNGGTNQTIGLAHGMQLLSTGDPYDAPTLPANTTRYIILLSDGLNTMDRWYGNGSSQSSSVDNRMTAACNYAKGQGFIIYTVFVDLNGTSGNSSVLQGCASDSSKYFDLTTSGAIITTFNKIAQEITNLRVSM
jgi:Flp pilus assembly protein TadG